MEWLSEIIGKAIDSKFSGCVEINFFNGGIANVSVRETLKPPNNWKTELAVRLVKSQQIREYRKPTMPDLVSSLWRWVTEQSGIFIKENKMAKSKKKSAVMAGFKKAKGLK